MLLNVYLGTTVASWVTILIFSTACEKKLKREGYKFVKQKKSFAEKLASFISTLFKSSIPVYNIINAIVIICMVDKFYDYIKDKLLERGIIYMPQDKSVNTQPEMESTTFENTDTIQKVNVEKKYEDMSFEEKMTYLEREKEILLRQKASTSDESLSENLSEQGLTLKRTFNSKSK